MTGYVYVLLCPLLDSWSSNPGFHSPYSTAAVVLFDLRVLRGSGPLLGITTAPSLSKVATLVFCILYCHSSECWCYSWF